MSEFHELTLPLRPADAATSTPSDSTSNINQGTGTQNITTQTGGYGNSLHSAGTQNFHYHEPPRSRVKQPWHLPRQAAGNYAGYAEVSTRLETCFLGPQPDDEQVVFVLSGMGGVGKSESVLQFLKKHNKGLRKKFWATFWIDCSSETTVRAEYKAVSKLCGWDPDESDLFCGAKDQLASLDECTLLILDNCDDPKTNFSRYIPSSPQVSVIFTTRLFDAGRYASLDPHNINKKLFLRLDGLDQGSAVTLILSASDVQERDEKTSQYARYIANTLEHHPLALVVASSLIQSTSYSLEEYTEALTSRFTQTELLNTESEQATYRKVSATFEVSADTLKHMAATDRSAEYALALLDIMGFMHHHGISEDIFLRAWDYAEEVSLESSDDDWSIRDLTSWHVAQCQRFAIPGSPEEKKRMFRSCRAHLVELSLVSLDSTGGFISLHSLIHTWVRERLQHPSEAWTAVASILALSTLGRRDWQYFTPQLAKHLETCYSLCAHSSDSENTGLQFSRIWYAFAWQMHGAGSSETLVLCQKIAEELRCEGSDGDLLESVQYLLGILYQDDGQIPRAIEILEHVVKIEEKKLAEDHPDRLASHHELASAYRADGQIPRAIEILEHIVKVQEKKLAEDHPSRLASQHELASVYQADGQISRAIEILEHVVKVEAKKLVEDHPDRLASQHELARAYQADGQISRAIEILEHVVKVQEKKLAEDHPSRLASQYELARAYQADGQISRAIEILEHVVKVEEKKLAEDHPDRLVSQHNLATAYWNNGQRIEAEQLMKRVVVIQRTSLRVDHPDRILSEGWLAYMAEQDSQWETSSSGSSTGAEQASDDRLVQTPSEDAACGADVQEE